MTKGRWVGVAAAVVWSALGVGSILAAPQERGERAARATRAHALASYLGLDAAQQASWRSLHQEARTRTRALAEQGRGLRQALRAALEAPTPDARAVGEATLALAAHRRQLRSQRDELHRQLTALLSPEQRQKLEAFEAARRVMRGPGRDAGRGGLRPAALERRLED